MLDVNTLSLFFVGVSVGVLCGGLLALFWWNKNLGVELSRSKIGENVEEHTDMHQRQLEKAEIAQKRMDDLIHRFDHLDTQMDQVRTQVQRMLWKQETSSQMTMKSKMIEVMATQNKLLASELHETQLNGVSVKKQVGFEILEEDALAHLLRSEEGPVLAESADSDLKDAEQGSATDWNKFKADEEAA